MVKKEYSSLPIWQFDNFSSSKGIKHFVSSRHGGHSNGDFGALNLSFKVGDDPELVEKNRADLAAAFGISSDKLLFPVQTHSNNVKIVSSKTTPIELEDTDAIITSEKGLLISVMSADCVPILLYDLEKGVVASIHAGWRGTIGEIVKHTIEKMKEAYGVEASTIIAGVGPSISDEIYEVGEEVIEAVVRVYGSKEGIISKEKNGKGFCNLWEANRIQLLRAGLKTENIEVASICTFKNADTFFSHRKSGGKTGRFAAGIMLI